MGHTNIHCGLNRSTSFSKFCFHLCLPQLFPWLISCVSFEICQHYYVKLQHVIIVFVCDRLWDLWVILTWMGLRKTCLETTSSRRDFLTQNCEMRFWLRLPIRWVCGIAYRRKKIPNVTLFLNNVFAHHLCQVWRNPNILNSERGWLLLSSCLSTFLPSQRMAKFLLK